MKSFFHNFVGSGAMPTTQARPASRGFQPQLENLENRLVPASMTIENGDIHIVGNQTNDYVTVADRGAYYAIEINPYDYSYQPEDYLPRYVYKDVAYGDEIWFYGLNGDDYFVNNSNLMAHASGGYGRDTLVGGPNRDWLYGDQDYDWLYGEGGNDDLFGGYDSWENYMRGGEGDDWMQGAYATDYMYGDGGSDTMYGRSGDDYLYGGTGKDYLYGEWGNDNIDGGDDGYADYLVGGPGADRFQRDYAYVYAVMRYGSSGYWYDREYVADYNWWDGDYFYD